MKRMPLLLALFAVLAGPALAAPPDDGAPAAKTINPYLPPLQQGMVHDFDQAQFLKVQSEGKRIMVMFASRWAGNSQERQPVVERISRDFLYPDVTFFIVDTDRHPDLLRQFHTLPDSVIVYRGIQERGRSGDIGEMELRHLLDSAR